MKSYENEMIKVLKTLNEANALPYLVISGSWATYFYKYVFENFIPRTETTDLDLYLPNPKRVKSESITSKLMTQKYYRRDDYMTGKTTFMSEEGFSIEFLTVPDRTMSKTIKVSGLDVVAEALPKMAPAGWDYIQVEYENMTVNVVSPVSFVLQKLLINKERQPEYKREKDIDAVKYVLSFVKASQKYSDSLKMSLEQYPKKWKKTILDTASANEIEL